MTQYAWIPMTIISIYSHTFRQKTFKFEITVFERFGSGLEWPSWEFRVGWAHFGPMQINLFKKNFVLKE